MSGPPRRWLEDDSTPPDARALLSAAPAPAEMSDEAFERSAARVALLATTPVAATGLAAKLFGSSLAKGLGAAAIGTAVVFTAVVFTAVVGMGLVGTAVVDTGLVDTGHDGPVVTGAALGPARPTPPDEAVPPGVAPLPSIPGPERAAVPPAVAVADPTPARSDTHASGSPGDAPASGPAPASASLSETAAPGDSLARETGVLRRARAALERAPGRALTLADRHARRFPRGQLWAERETIAVDALTRLERPDEAQARAERFIAAAPPRMYVRRVRRLVANP